MYLNFMRIEDVVMSGNGFYQSMAYHAYTQLSLFAFVFQCLYCISSILLGYIITKKISVFISEKWPNQIFLASFIKNVFPAIISMSLMLLVLLISWMNSGGWYKVLVIWKVTSLTLWVFFVRLGGWIFRSAMRPHGLLRFFLWLIEWSLVLMMVFTFFGLLNPVISAIESMKFAIGDQVFKGGNILSGVVMAVLAFTIAGQLSQLVEVGLQRYSRLKTIQANDALILSRLFSSFIFISLTMAVLVGSGIEATTLAAFAGAMGIGLGFGMQKMVVNFFSGLYVLFERTIKVGDYVTVNNITGRVVQLTGRAVMVRDAVGTESVIPNSELTKRVIQNHTLSNDDFRVSFKIDIAEIHNFVLAKQIIFEALNNHPRVLKDEPMHVQIIDISSDHVRLEISCWINDLQNGQSGLISDLLYDIGMSLREKGVTLAGSMTSERELAGVGRVSPA